MTPRPDKSYMITLLITNTEGGTNPGKWDWEDLLNETGVTVIDCKEVT